MPDTAAYDIAKVKAAAAIDSALAVLTGNISEEPPAAAAEFCSHYKNNALTTVRLDLDQRKTGLYPTRSHRPAITEEEIAKKLTPGVIINMVLAFHTANEQIKRGQSHRNLHEATENIYNQMKNSNYIRFKEADHLLLRDLIKHGKQAANASLKESGVTSQSGLWVEELGSSGGPSHLSH